MSDPTSESQTEQITSDSIRPRRQPQSPSPEPGILESGWGTGIFLVGGLALLVSLIVGGIWIYKEISSSIEAADKLAESRQPPPRPQLMPPVLPDLHQQPHRNPNELPPTVPRPRNRRAPTSPSQITTEERDQLFRSLRTRDDEDSRSEDIREGYSIERMPKTEEERLEQRKMRKLIESFMVNNEEGIGAEIQLKNLYHPGMLARIRGLLPAELASQQILTLRSKYLPVAFQGVRVVSFKDVSDPMGEVRVVYCQMGPHIIVPYRIYLLKVGNDWKLIDFESLHYGLSYCEVVSMYSTIYWLDSRRLEMIDGRLAMASNINQTVDGTPFFDQYRKDVFPLVPQPLRDYLACAITAQLAFRPSARQFRSDCLQQVEFPHRFGLVHQTLSSSASQDSRWEDALEHSQAYIDLFGNASPVVQIDAAVALLKLSRMDDSRTMWRQLLTAAPQSPFAVMTIGELIETQKWPHELDGLIEEFQLRDEIEEWQKRYREKYGNRQPGESQETKPETSATPSPPRQE